jgi:hypothetical protein
VNRLANEEVLDDDDTGDDMCFDEKAMRHQRRRLRWTIEATKGKD